MPAAAAAGGGLLEDRDLVRFLRKHGGRLRAEKQAEQNPAHRSEASFAIEVRSPISLNRAIPRFGRVRPAGDYRSGAADEISWLGLLEADATPEARSAGVGRRRASETSGQSAQRAK